jgi:phosphomannomutase / phosphoglucomutase
MTAAAKFDIDVVRHVFRAYDIRGVADTEITEEFAYRLGLAFVRHLREAQGNVRAIALGRDNRPSSARLHAALRDGLLAENLEVHDLGLVSSPMVGYAVCRWRLDGGVCVTGSHNSPSSNGFKLDGADAFPLADDDIEHVRTLMGAAGTCTGLHGMLTPVDMRDAYVRALASLVQVARPITVAVDAGNGVMGLFVPELLRRLGCDVMEIHCQPDSSFPNHIPNPEDPANMRELQEHVMTYGADVGLAFDGDGDRLGVVDETGAIFDPGKILMVLARDLLQRWPGSPVIIDVKSSRTVIEDISLHGGLPLLTRTGHSLIRRRMATEGVLLGGEHSGHLFCAEDYYGTSDALLAAAKLIALLSRHSTPLSLILEPLPQRFASDLIEVPVPDEQKHRIAEMAAEELSRRYTTVRIDGVRAEMEDGWALVRASNTGPRIALRFEADSQERLGAIQSEVLALLGGLAARAGVSPPLRHS